MSPHELSAALAVWILTGIRIDLPDSFLSIVVTLT
jgi:hypothetical protein